MRTTAAKRFTAILITGASLALSGPAGAQQAAPTAARPSQADIERIVRDYLLKHPEVLVEAMQNFRMRQEEAKAAAQRKAISTRRKEIFNDPGSPVGGNADGDVTMVEFFDYRCGVCKRVHPTVTKLLETDGKIRQIYKEWPILGPESVFAARAALASRQQGKYLPFHNAMMEFRGSLTPDKVLSVANSVGIDVNKLRQDMDDPDINKILTRNYKLAEALQITGTPSFLFGDILVPGARDLDSLRAIVQKVRDGG